jgi:hypothetical protein
LASSFSKFILFPYRNAPNNINSLQGSINFKRCKATSSSLKYEKTSFLKFVDSSLLIQIPQY